MGNIIMEDIYSQLKIPVGKKYTSISKEKGEFIYRFLRRQKLRHTLETGFAYGCSTAYIISATNSTHIAIDPFQSKYNNLGLKNIKKLQLDKHLRYIGDYSHNALPQLLKERTRLDFAFIDGDHNFDVAFMDFFYIDLMLVEKGFVLFDDSWIHSIQTIAKFIVKNKKNYRKIKTPCKNLILFQKISEDKQQWHNFKSFKSYNLISLMKTKAYPFFATFFPKFLEKWREKNWGLF